MTEQRLPTTPVQRSEAWLQMATPEQIAGAYKAGELHELQGGKLNELGNPVDDKGRLL